MPKAEEPKHNHAPVSVEDIREARGQDPYAVTGSRAPVEVSMEGDIPQFPSPPRFPDPEVVVEALCRGVKDRGFTFGVGPDGKWPTTWQRAEELAGKVKIIKILKPKPDAASA
jgi:hypothetical protein